MKKMGIKWGEIDVGKIVPPINGELIFGQEKSTVTGLTTDSREIIEGQIFLALRGEKYDGHDFIHNVIEKGASGVIVEKGRIPELSPGSDTPVIVVPDTLTALGDLANWWRSHHNVLVAVITGSAGKTTVKEMTFKILELDSRTLKNRGNFNNLIGLPLTLLGLGDDDRMAVLEMGMNRPGEIGRLTDIAEPDIGLITNVGRAHLEGLGDIQGVAKAKTELLERISTKGNIILNGDDELLMNTAESFSRSKITFGIGSANQIKGEKIRNLGSEGISFNLRIEGKLVPIKLGVPGEQNVMNALAASSIAVCMGIPIDKIVKGLEGFNGVEGRFKPVKLPGNITLIDDTYNSNPSSLKAAMDSMRSMSSEGRIIVGLGEMLELGKETIPAHLDAGGLVAEVGASYFFAMGEHAQEMITGAVANGLPMKRAIKVESHLEMTEKLRDVIKNGDFILLKGSRKLSLEKVAQGLINGLSKEYSHA